MDPEALAAIGERDLTVEEKKGLWSACYQFSERLKLLNIIMFNYNETFLKSRRVVGYYCPASLRKFHCIQNYVVWCCYAV